MGTGREPSVSPRHDALPTPDSNFVCCAHCCVLCVECCVLYRVPCFLCVAGLAIKLEEVFDVVKEIQINLDAKMDEAIRLAAGKEYGLQRGLLAVVFSRPVRHRVMGEGTCANG